MRAAFTNGRRSLAEKITRVNRCVKVCAIFLRPYRACWVLSTVTQVEWTPRLRQAVNPAFAIR